MAARAGRPTAVHNDDRLAERLGKLGADEPSDEVRSASGRNRYDKLDRSARIGLGPRQIRPSADKGHDHE